MRTFALIPLFLLSVFCAKAQDDNLPSLTDSIRIAFSQEPRLIARFSTHNAFVTGRPIRTYGAKIGVSYSDRIVVGIGYNWLRHGESVIREVAQTEEVRELRMDYLNAYFEYSFVYRKHWQIIIPVSFGIGRNREFLAGTDTREFVNSGTVLLYEPAMIAEYHFLRYFGIGAGVGYRLMLLSNRAIPEQFTAPTWQLRFRIMLGDIRQDLENHWSE